MWFRDGPAGNLQLRWVPPDAPIHQPAQALSQAAALAGAADVAIVFAADSCGEGHDRQNLFLPGTQEELILAIAQANPRTIVVLHTSGPVTMPWRDAVPVVFQAWCGGSAAGDAIADVLVGLADPG